jgi:MYXO-CTERM domain-containing protein
MTMTSTGRVWRRAVVALAIAAWGVVPAAGCSSSEEPTAKTSQALSTGLVISQVYGGGGNGGATYTHDFVELFNRGTTPVSVQGLMIQRTGATTDFSNSGAINIVTITDADVVPPGGYYLVQLASQANVGSALPTPDFTGGLTLGGTNGKVALVQNTALNACGSTADGGVPCNTANIIDLVGYGTTATMYEGAGPTANLSNTTAAIRAGGGCTETDNNNTDFAVATPTPRNSGSAVNLCSAADAGDASIDVAEDADAGGDVIVPMDGDTDASDAGADVMEDASDAGVDVMEDASDAGVDVMEDASDAGVDVMEDASDAGVDASAPDAGDASSSDGGPTDAGADAPLSDGVGIVISQVYGGGGNSQATFTHDYVELFNRSNQPVSLNGLSIQYGSATGSFANPSSDGGPGSGLTALPNVTVPPGKYFLVQLDTNGATGSALPTPDFTGGTDLGATNGKVALARITTSLGCGGSVDGGTRCPTTNIVDMIGYGTASDYEGSGAAAALGNTKAAKRKGNGCVDTNQNQADITAETPAPRNSQTAAVDCSQIPTDAGTDSGVKPDAGKDASTGTDSGTVADSGGGRDSGGGTDSGTGGGTDEDTGCSCSTPGTKTSPNDAIAFGGLALGVGLVLARRRRR